MENEVTSTAAPEENQEFDTSPVPDSNPVPVTNKKPRYIPVPRWNYYYPWPPPGGMRHLIFHAKTNGFAPAFFRVGRSILIDADCFWSIAKKQGEAK